MGKVFESTVLVKTEANALMKESKTQVSVSPNDVTLEHLKCWKRLSSALRGRPISKESALESAIKMEMKLLSNPEMYSSQLDTKPKDQSKKVAEGKKEDKTKK